MLIGEEKINAVFDSWLKKCGFDARCEGLDNDFYWNVDKDTISYSFVVAEKYDKAFRRVCENLGLAYEIDIFWLSFLHELGHSMTYHEVDYLIEPTGTGDEYYYHPREYVATEWAVDFINQHIDKVLDLMEMSRPAIVEFFVVNNIQSDD